MKERYLSKTPFLTFVYISKCNINLPGYFGNSKKRFLWTGLIYTYIRKVESRAVFCLSRIRKNHILGLILKRSSRQNRYFQNKADKNKLPMNAFVGWQIILVKQRFNVKLLWCYYSTSLFILPYHNIAKGKTDPRAECCCETKYKQDIWELFSLEYINTIRNG